MKSHLIKSREIRLTIKTPITTLYIRKILNKFSDDISLNVKFENRENRKPENIICKVYYINKKTGEELEKSHSINNVDKNFRKLNGHNILFKKQVSDFMADSIEITTNPFSECDFWLIPSFV